MWSFPVPQTRHPKGQSPGLRTVQWRLREGHQPSVSACRAVYLKLWQLKRAPVKDGGAGVHWNLKVTQGQLLKIEVVSVLPLSSDALVPSLQQEKLGFISDISDLSSPWLTAAGPAEWQECLVPRLALSGNEQIPLWLQLKPKSIH